MSTGCRRMAVRWDGVGARVSFVVDGVPEGAELIDLSGQGLQVVMDAGSRIAEKGTYSMCLEWGDFRIDGRLTVRHLTESLSRGLVVGGTFDPADPRGFAAFLGAIAERQGVRI